MTPWRWAGVAFALAACATPAILRGPAPGPRPCGTVSCPYGFDCVNPDFSLCEAPLAPATTWRRSPDAGVR